MRSAEWRTTWFPLLEPTQIPFLASAGGPTVLNLIMNRNASKPLLSVVSGGDDDGHVVVLPDELVDLVAGLVVVVGFHGSPAVAHQPHALLVATSQRSFRVTTHRSSRGRGCWAYRTPPCRSPGRRPSVDCRTRGPASSVTRGDTL